MVFCGQCGSLLSPRDLTCPNCGAATEADQSAEDVSTDAPTVASSLPGYPLSTPQSQHPASPPPAPRQQKLVLPGNVPAGIEPPGIIPAEVYAPDTPRACSTSETPEKRWSGCLTRRFARFACHTRWHGGGCAEAKWLIGQRWHSNAAYSFSYSTSSGAYPAVLRRHQQAGLPRCLQLVGDRPAASNPNL